MPRRPTNERLGTFDARHAAAAHMHDLWTYALDVVALRARHLRTRIVPARGVLRSPRVAAVRALAIIGGLSVAFLAGGVCAVFGGYRIVGRVFDLYAGLD